MRFICKKHKGESVMKETIEDKPEEISATKYFEFLRE